jgi:hypothetical protein
VGVMEVESFALLQHREGTGRYCSGPELMAAPGTAGHVIELLLVVI